MVKRFIPYYKPHQKLLYMDLICALFLSCLELVFPSVIRIFIDTLLPLNSLRLIIISGCILVTITILRAFVQFIITYWGHALGAHIEHDMRNDLFRHLHTLSFNFFDNTKTGHIMSKVVNDIFQVVEVAHHFPEHVFTSSIMILGSVIILFRYNWVLTLVIIGIVPLMALYAHRYNRKMHKRFAEVREKVADINASVEDSIAGVRVVKSFTNEELEFKKLKKSNKKLLDSRLYSFKTMAYFFSGINFYTYLMKIMVFFAGALFVFYKKLSVGEMVSFLLYINLFLNPVNRLINSTEEFQRGMAGFRRFMEIMDKKPEIVDRPDAFCLQSVKGNIAFHKVHFSYHQGQYVFRDLDLEIEAGKTVALVGPSGVGKTTICNLIPRFYEIEKGSITIDKNDIRNVTLKSLRDQIGIVQQDVFLFAGTVRDNLVYGKMDASGQEIIAAAEKAHAHEFINQLPDKYDSYIGERGIKLSGGQKQRLSIARMFLKNPPILILDEATSSLDNESEKIIQQSLQELTKNRTTFIIAHRLTTIKNADIILVLTEIGIAEKGTHTELLAREGVYAKLYTANNYDLAYMKS